MNVGLDNLQVVGIVRIRNSENGFPIHPRAYERPLVLHYTNVHTILTNSACPGSLGIITVMPRHNKTNKMSVRPAKTQISLGFRPV